MRKAFFPVLAAAAIFVCWSAGVMPSVVASHFAGGGVANGFMPRGQYVGFMLAVVVLVPSLLFFIGPLASRLPVQLINLPNRQYWLAPERRAATLVSLGNFGVWVAYATLGLLCLVNWFVVQANLQQPPRLEQPPLVGALSLFFVALFVGMMVVLRRFFRVP
jgi:hypothetical protein